MSSTALPLSDASSKIRSGPAISAVSSALTRTSPSVTSGPAAATRNSAPGESVSRLIFITPPNRNSSIPVTSIPSRRAATAWPSSCNRIDPKNNTAAATATPKPTLSDVPSASRKFGW